MEGIGEGGLRISEVCLMACELRDLGELGFRCCLGFRVEGLGV